LVTTPWDRLGAQVKRSSELAERQPDEHGRRAAERVRLLRELCWAIEAEIDAEVARAKDQGASWKGWSSE
jgi:hypothetical protein